MEIGIPLSHGRSIRIPSVKIPFLRLAMASFPAPAKFPVASVMGKLGTSSRTEAVTEGTAPGPDPPVMEMPRVHCRKYPLISRIKSVEFVTNAPIEPFVPAGMRAAFELMTPSKALSMEASGNWPKGESVR